MSTTTDIHGPIDFVLLQFPTDRLTGEASGALADLVERGIVRIYDLLVIRKDESGAVEVLEIENPAHGASSFSYFSGARSGILGDEDAQEAASAMDPGTVAALIVYENTWAIPFVKAARSAGAEVVAAARIPADTVMEVLAAAEAAN